MLFSRCHCWPLFRTSKSRVDKAHQCHREEERHTLKPDWTIYKITFRVANNISWQTEKKRILCKKILISKQFQSVNRTNKRWNETKNEQLSLTRGRVIDGRLFYVNCIAAHSGVNNVYLNALFFIQLNKLHS